MSRHFCVACGVERVSDVSESIPSHVGMAELLVPNGRGGYDGWKCCVGCVDRGVMLLRSWGHRDIQVMQPVESVALVPDRLEDRVATLRVRADRLDELCGEMIATMLVNMKSGRMTTSNDEEFGKMIEAWREMRMKA